MLQRNYSDKLHIKIFNSMIDDKSNTKLSPIQLYIYCMLCVNSTSDEDRMMPTSVDMINYMSPFRFAVKDNNNKKHIKDSLLQLIIKGYLLIADDYIRIDNNSQPDIKNNTFLTLEINHDGLENKFEKLYYNEFRFLKNPDELFIYIVSKRFTGFSEGFKGSYSRWGKLLKLSDKTVIHKLDDAEKGGVIKVLRGRHISQNQQEINIYTHVDLMEKEDYEEVEVGQLNNVRDPEEKARNVFG
ncbi:hypothetical protein [Virgibacillus sp. CBA3643]|uniref:hypothetical protein n=1 Tax=Virgibacillus sp. CBA3643 TaxID=2942278 RepID=UPI0035A3726A